MEPLAPSSSPIPLAAAAPSGPGSAAAPLPVLPHPSEPPQSDLAASLVAEPRRRESSAAAQTNSSVQRPRLQSIVVGTIQVPVDAAHPQNPPNPPPAGRKRVSFDLTPAPPASHLLNASHCSTPVHPKSCLRSTMSPRTGSSSSAIHDDAPSRCTVDWMGTHDGEAGWSRVLPKHCWRRSDFTNAVDSRRPSARAPRPRPSISESFQGKCLCCLAGGTWRPPAGSR